MALFDLEASKIQGDARRTVFKETVQKPMVVLEELQRFTTQDGGFV